MKLKDQEHLLHQIIDAININTKGNFPAIVLMVDADSGDIAYRTNCGTQEDMLTTLQYVLDTIQDNALTPDMETKGNA